MQHIKAVYQQHHPISETHDSVSTNFELQRQTSVDDAAVKCDVIHFYVVLQYKWRFTDCSDKAQSFVMNLLLKRH